MDDTIDDFKMILERKKKYKLTQISKFLSPNAATTSQQQQQQTQPTTSGLKQSVSQDSSFLSSESMDEFKERGESKISLSKLNSSIFSTQALDKKPRSKLPRTTSTISKYFTTSQDSKAAEEAAPVTVKFACPLCSFDLTSYGDSERQLHVNKCLDKGFSSNSKAKEETRSKIEPAKVLIDSPPPPPVAAASSETTIESMLKEMVPNCPICGKVLNSFSVCCTLFVFSPHLIIE